MADFEGSRGLDYQEPETEYCARNEKALQFLVGNRVKTTFLQPARYLGIVPEDSREYHSFIGTGNTPNVLTALHIPVGKVHINEREQVDCLEGNEMSLAVLKRTT